MVMDGLDGPLDVKVHWSTIIFNEPITAKRVEKVGWFFVRAEIVYQDRMCIVAQLKQGIGI